MCNIKIRRGFVGLMVFTLCMLVSTPTLWSGPIEEAAQLTKDYLKAFNEGNAEALSALFAKDGVYLAFASPFPAMGREAIRAGFEGFFKMYPIRYLFSRDESRRAYGDTVTLYNNWTLIYGDAKGNMKTVYGRNAAVNTIVEGKRLILIQDGSLLPVVGP
jgi:uncharacterized protein (TIGR02246 family)